MAEEPITFVTGSGNVFADLGEANPYMVAMRADIIMHLQDTINEKKLSAKDLNVDRIVYTCLTSHKFADHKHLSLEKLMALLDEQGYKIEATISKK